LRGGEGRGGRVRGFLSRFLAIERERVDLQVKTPFLRGEREVRSVLGGGQTSPGCCMRLTWGIGRDRPRAPCSALDGSRPNAWRGGQTSCMNSIADRLPDRPISSRSQPIGARERETDRGEVRAGGGGGGTRGIPPSQGYRGHGHAGFIPEIPNRRQ